MDVLDTELNKSKVLLAIYVKRLQKIRALLFFVITILLLLVITPAIDNYKNLGETPAAGTFVLIAVVLLLLSITLASYKWPFMSLTAFAILDIVGVIFYLIVFVVDASNTQGVFNPLPALSGIIVGGTITFFIINGAIVAKKYEKLDALIKTLTRPE